MPVQVTGPDGRQYQFPDGTDKAAAIGYFKKKGIGVKAPTAPQPEARTIGNYLNEGVRGVGRGLENDVTGVAQALRHPLKTATGISDQSRTAYQEGLKEFEQTKGATLPQRTAAAALTGLENAPVIGGMVQKAEEGGTKIASPEALGAATEGITTLAAPEVAGRGVAKVMSKVPEVARAITKTTPKETAALVDETQKTNAGSAAKAGEAKAVETKRADLQKQIHETSRELQARTETAREHALKVGNEKYNTVNEKLNPIPADMETIHGLYHEAAESIGEAGVEPTVVKRLGTALEHGAELSYKDEQALYSELGKELSKGTLPGETYHAYDLLQEGIGEDMQRIADSQGQGAQLSDARNYWRRLKQTFGKPFIPRDAATRTLRSLSPDFAKEEAAKNQVRLLSHYDPEIERAANDVTEARKGLKSLPKAKPTEAPAKTIGTEDIRTAKEQGFQEGAERVRKYGRKIVNYGVGLHALWDAFSGRMNDLPRDFALGAAGYGAAEAFARLLERPAIRELLTNPTQADIAQIPPELRGNLGPMLNAAQKQGIKVSPLLINLTTGAAVAGQPKRVAAALTAQ